MKCRARYYRGIEFVCIEELSAVQKMQLQQSTGPERIKIMVDGKIIPDCILYKDYENWYTAVFQRSPASVKQTIGAKEEIGRKRALHKSILPIQAGQMP